MSIDVAHLRTHSL